jgi:hypothetical protein
VTISVHDTDLRADAGFPEANDKTGSGARRALDAWFGRGTLTQA